MPCLRTGTAPFAQTAHERVRVNDPVKRLRVLAGLTSNVSLNAARSIASGADNKQPS